MILNIHQATTTPLYSVLNGISEEQFRWRPAPESRSISEMMCHLIRIDNSFLQKLGQSIKTQDPRNGTADDVLMALQNVHRQMYDLVNDCKDDSELFRKSTLQDAEDIDTIKEHVLHSCQHNLYHLSQMIYLRRALDRNWISPIEEWDKATRVIANYLASDTVN